MSAELNFNRGGGCFPSALLSARCKSDTGHTEPPTKPRECMFYPPLSSHTAYASWYGPTRKQVWYVAVWKVYRRCPPQAVGMIGGNRCSSTTASMSGAGYSDDVLLSGVCCLKRRLLPRSSMAGVRRAGQTGLQCASIVPSFLLKKPCLSFMVKNFIA